jgi:hypothetical protein
MTTLKIPVFENVGTGGEFEEENKLCILSMDMQAINNFLDDDLTGSLRRIGGYSPSPPSPDKRGTAPRGPALYGPALYGPAPCDIAPREPTCLEHAPCGCT